MTELLQSLEAFASRDEGSKKLFSWIDAKGNEAASLSINELWRKSGYVADKLIKKGIKAGDRVMIVYPFGLDFLPGLLGCFRAGVVAVSVYPPKPSNLNADIKKFAKFFRDSGASIALTTAEYYYLAKMHSFTAPFTGGTPWPEGLKWLTTDDNVRTDYQRQHPDAAISGDDLMFLQYSSGSTGDPKGVMVTVRNLDANLRCIVADTRIKYDSVGVTWVPQYHDYGLICSYLLACKVGALCVSMSPLTFIKNPLMWPELIQKFRATVTLAPNFAYWLLKRRMDETGDTFDLSSLDYVNISTEPIAPSTLGVMVDLGIPSRAIDQSYGMSEFVGHVLAGGKGVDPDTGLVACGSLSGAAKFDKYVVVVDNDNQIVPEGVVGNIMATGPDLVAGYWGKDELTEKTMRIKLNVPGVDASKNWFQSGDVGYIKGDQLYIGGRAKELIIIQGRNFCPQDIERAVEHEFPNILRPAFTCAGQLDEKSAFVVAELYPHASPLSEDDVGRLRRTVAAACDGMKVGKIVLLRKGALPKTTSGKLRRIDTRNAIQGSGLDPKGVIQEWSFVDTDYDPAEEQVEGHPFQQKHPKVGIVGAGPSGLVAALTLLDLGYKRITIFEREDHVGGRSVGMRDYDEFYIGSTVSGALRAIADRFGVSGAAIGGSAETCDRTTCLLDLPEPIAMPYTSVAITNQADSVPISVVSSMLYLWSKAGYGIIDCDSESQPEYVKTFSALVNLTNAVSDSEIAATNLLPDRFFKQLWSAVVDHLRKAGVEIKLSHSVRSVEKTIIDGEKFDSVIISTMPKDALNLGLGQGNSFISQGLGEVQYNRYGVVAFEADGLNPDQPYAFLDAHRQKRLVGSPLVIYQKQNVWYELVYASSANCNVLGSDVPNASSEEISQDQILTNLRECVAAQGGHVTRVLDMKIWDFFPYLPEKKLKDDSFFDKWETEIQGQDGIYWTGPLFGFELTETVVRHAHEMVKRHFPLQYDDEYPLPMDQELFHLELTYKELYPQFPLGPTIGFSKYYSWTQTGSVHRTGECVFDLVGSLEIDPDSAIPGDLVELMFGSSPPSSQTVRARFSETLDKPAYIPAEVCPSLFLSLENEVSLIFTSVFHVAPIHMTDLYYDFKGLLEGVQRVFGRKRWWEHDFYEQLKISHAFDCTLAGWGPNDFFQTENHIGVVSLIPQAKLPRKKNDGSPLNAHEAMELSHELLRKNDFCYELRMQVFPWKEMDFILDKNTVHIGKWNDFALNNDVSASSFKLGTLRFPRQDTAMVDHDYDVPFVPDLQRSTLPGRPRNFTRWPTFLSTPMKHYQAISTKEYEARFKSDINSIDEFVLARASALISCEVSRDDSPMNLGFASVQMVQLASYVEAVFHVELPVTLFFDLPTFGDIIDYVEAEARGAMYTPDETFKLVSYSEGKVVRTGEVATNLWCLPPILGSGVYRRLSKRLPHDFVLTEVVALSLYANKMEEPPSFDKLAEDSAGAIKAQQPNGPYHLCGYSFGSALGHAVAIELGATTMICIDGPAPGVSKLPSVRFSKSDKMNKYINTQIQGLNNREKAEPAHSAKVSLVKAGDQSFFAEVQFPDSASLGWSYIEPDLETHVIDGAHHLSIMSEPYVEEVAELVKQYCMAT